MEEKIRNDVENNTENKQKLTSHLDELVDSMTTKPGCGPVFSGLDVLPDMIKEYDILDEMAKNDPVLAEEMRKEEEKEIVVEDITLEEILEDISNGALVNFGNSNCVYDSVNLRSPSPDVDGVSNFPYTSSNLRANRQPKIGRGLPSIDDGRKAGEANRTTQKTLERTSGGMPG